MIIREFSPDDVDAYCKIRLEALETDPDAFGRTAEEFKSRSHEFYVQRVQNNYASADIVTLGAFVDNQPVGMMGIIRKSNPKLRHIVEVFGVYVSPESRGQHIGSKLLDALIEQAKQMDGVEQLYLGVVRNNQAAITLYKSREFTQYGLSLIHI